jgi:hypothetical protein
MTDKRKSRRVQRRAKEASMTDKRKSRRVQRRAPVACCVKLRRNQWQIVIEALETADRNAQARFDMKDHGMLEIRDAIIEQLAHNKELSEEGD